MGEWYEFASSIWQADPRDFCHPLDRAGPRSFDSAGNARFGTVGRSGRSRGEPAMRFRRGLRSGTEGFGAGDLYLLVPGLLGPFSASIQPLAVPRLPSLEKLLRRGRRRPYSGHTLTEVAIRLFRGASGDEHPPVAAFLRVSDGLTDQELDWVCAAPVLLRADQDRVLLSDLPGRELSLDQASRLGRRLTEHFSERGWVFQVTAPDRWYLGRRGAQGLEAAPLEAVIGRNIDSFLPGGGKGAYWRAMLNEIQMVLHSWGNLPFAESLGDGVEVNGLWLWGGGELPEAPECPKFVHVASDNPLVRGLAHWGGCRVGEGADMLGVLVAAASEGPVLGVVDAPARSVLDVDPIRWGEVLEAHEESLWRPLEGALRSGRLASVNLFPCEGTTIEVRRRDLYRVWKRGRNLADWAVRKPSRRD